MRLQRNTMAVAATVVSLTCGGGAAWACTGPGDPGSYSTTSSTTTTDSSTTTTTSTTAAAADKTARTHHSKRHAKRHHRRNARRN
jgi:hypothetical protein